MEILNTAFTIFGYECTLGDNPEPIARGGNAPMCSETMLIPRYVGEERSFNNTPIKLIEVKKLAKLRHGELVAEHGYVDGHIYHDRDSQDEILCMLNMGDHPSASKRTREEEKRRYAKLFAGFIPSAST